MNTMVTVPNHHQAQQRRLRAAVKRLVIELGYLEQCLAEGLQDSQVRTAAQGLDRAIACLNEHLTRR